MLMNVRFNDQAKALGANVTAISHSDSKKEDAMKMGATTFIATHGDDKNAFKPYKRSLDLIICTTSECPSLSYVHVNRYTRCKVVSRFFG